MIGLLLYWVESSVNILRSGHLKEERGHISMADKSGITTAQTLIELNKEGTRFNCIMSFVK